MCLVFVFLFFVVFFFKQKTAYEMRISDWSSDVCSSDLMMAFGRDGILDSDAVLAVADYAKTLSDPAWAKGRAASVASGREVFAEIGRASCRERVCQYV